MADFVEIKSAALLDEIRKEVSGDLRRAQKMEALGTLVGGIAHDFNNILAIMQANLNLLQDEGDDPITRSDALDLAQKTLHRATGVVRQLLTFARKTDITFEHLDLDGLLEELLAMVREAFPKTIEISFTSDRADHHISGDPNQLDQALLNLCINARDAMPAGGALDIDVRTVSGEPHTQVPETAETEYVRIAVRDTGTGMDEATRNRIFEPYFSTKDRQVSSGLGLAMVYGIVKLHQGFIQVDSEKGKGTTFRLYFPKLRREDSRTASASPKEEPASLMGNESVLFAEDEAMLLRVVRHAMERRGYHVFEAHDGLQAVETYRVHKDEIAIVVLDLGLPKLDGWTAFHEMKEINPGLKAIAISGYVDPELKQKMLQEGVKEVIVKPFQTVEMMRAIRTAIGRG